MPKLPTLHEDEVEVLRAGETVRGWKRLADGTKQPFEYTFTSDDVDVLETGYDPEGAGTARLGVDHRGTGPAYGLFDRVRSTVWDNSETGKTEKSFIAHLGHVADIVRTAVRTKAYNAGSAEILPNWKGRRLYFAGFDLLGAQWPAFGGLAPITLGAGDSPIQLSAGTERWVFSDDPVAVEIVPESAEYQDGALENELREEESQARMNRVMGKAWDLFSRIWCDPTKKAAEKLAAVQKIASDVSPLVADDALAPAVSLYSNGGMEMTKQEFDAQLTAAVKTAVDGVRHEFSSTVEALKTELAAAKVETTAAIEKAQTEARRAEILTFASTALPVGASDEAKSELEAFCFAIAPVEYAVGDQKKSALEFFKAHSAARPAPRVPTSSFSHASPNGAAVTQPAPPAAKPSGYLELDPENATAEMIQFANAFNEMLVANPTGDIAAIAKEAERLHPYRASMNAAKG